MLRIQNFSKALPMAVLSLAAIALSGCMQDIPMVKRESAMRTALPVHMIPRVVPAEPFTLQAYERVHKKFSTAVLYIEGDGIPYTIPSIVSLGLTPADPIGLRLAAQDGSPNVIYLARPCQYRNSKYLGKDECPEVFQKDAKYSEAVIHGYNRALDNIKAYHHITDFEIVGYDGGAAVAVILASQRNDIRSLRTVAGILDTKTAHKIRKIPELKKSYNPVDYSSKLTAMPQRHFIGKDDKIAPPAVYSSYAQALGPTACNVVSLVSKADHEHGWVEQWNVLRTLPVSCNGDAAAVAEPMPVTFDPTSLDGDKGVDRGQK